MARLYILAALALLASCMHPHPKIDWDSIDYGVPQRVPEHIEETHK